MCEHKHMSVVEQRTRVLSFIEQWRGHGDEKQETQRFWLDLLQNVLGVKDAISQTRFEYRTVGGGFIDVLCPEARLLVEQKSGDIDLDKPEPRQGTMVTPVQQALRYADALPPSLKPAVLCTCNFNTFRFYDLEKDPRATGKPIDEFTLEELGDHLGTLTSIFSSEHSRIMVQQKLSETAGLLVANLHNALASQYADPDDPASHHSLAVLTVRLVFCLYAEDAGLFPSNAFSDFVQANDTRHLRRAIMDLFDVLNTPVAARDPYLEDELKRFDYVNGGLFAERIEIPQFTDDIRQAIIRAGESFTWKDISPVIFGSLMEETLSHDQRRKGGMHYTTVKNIHRLIDPLFLDGLKAELKAIEDDEALGEKARGNRLAAYQDKLASLQFLDPACGSGNFLTETFLQLRELENRAIADRLHGQGYMDLGGEESLVKVSIDQMHGIEINDFAVCVAKTALWIAEQQALDDTESIAGQVLPHLPLHDSGNIVKANALRYDWNQLLPAPECSYIIGNPPFVGASLCDTKQKQDIVKLFGKIHMSNSLDYVAVWYYKACAMMKTNSAIRAAFVSTNSICQGEQVEPLWGTLTDRFGVVINFAHRTFVWDAQSTDNANVYVIIVGFALTSDKRKSIYAGEDDTVQPAQNINAYLVDAPSAIVSSRATPLVPMPRLTKGNQPSDGGNLILTEEERNDLLSKEPQANAWMHKYIGAKEFINGGYRWCLWLKNATPSDLLALPEVMKRVKAVQEFRQASSAKPTREKAVTPHLFFFAPQPDTDYLVVPRHSSWRRTYIPIGFEHPDVISSDAVSIVPNASRYLFGLMTSAAHNAWMRRVAGRLKNDYRYSGSLVYNTFPWPEPDDNLRTCIADAADHVLAARMQYADCSLAQMYAPDNAFLFPDLFKAHSTLDALVDQAFGIPTGLDALDDDARLTVLFTRYEKMTRV